VVAGVLWFLNYQNSRLINEKLRIIEKKDDLLNAVLEARRYEKNYFLTQDQSHLNEALMFIQRAQAKLRDIITQHAAYTVSSNLDQTLEHLDNYSQSLAMLAGIRGDALATQASGSFAGNISKADETRMLGQKITGEMEKMVKAERRYINRLLRDTKIYHFSALGGLVILSVFILVFFFFNVNRPLKTLEKAIREISSGHYENIPKVSAGLEFESLVSSLNLMIDKLNRRSHELIQTKKLASLGTLTSGVAHELNNPLNNISTSLQILIEEVADGDLEYKRDLLTGAEKEVERARDIVRALLEFSRQHAFSIKPVSIKSLVADTLKLIRGDLPANITLAVEIESEIHASLDFRRMQQVLLNLMLNGIQAMENGGTLTISAFRRTADEFCFQVSDTGSGIAPEHLNKIFDPFFSTREGRRKSDSDTYSRAGILSQEGTGLGLAICHGIIQKHGGDITVNSEPGKGTTFTVCLPIGSSHEPTV
jgi:signal transduction histidine kinase